MPKAPGWLILLGWLFWSFAILALAGCASFTVVHIHAQNSKDVNTKWFPFGVSISPQRGAADGVYIKSKSFGLLGGGLGLSKNVYLLGSDSRTIYTVDEDVCSLAVVSDPKRKLEDMDDYPMAYCKSPVLGERERK